MRYPMSEIIAVMAELAVADPDGEGTYKNADVMALVEWATFSKRSLRDWEELR